MKRFRIAFLLIATAAMMAYAAAPVASVTSSTAFDLHGNRVNVNGVPTWPVMAGDDIATQSGVAVIQLRDGSRVELQGGSRAKVETKDDGSLIVRLLSGAMRIVALGSGTKFYTQNAAVTPVVGQAVSIGPAPVVSAPVIVQAAAGRPAPISSR